MLSKDSFPQKNYQWIYEKAPPFIWKHLSPPNEIQFTRIAANEILFEIQPSYDELAPIFLGRIDIQRRENVRKSCTFEWEYDASLGWSSDTS
jgi:hypothetical protein